ncbi:RND family efflux transporter, MFP subunit [Abditibacterium utsteinense]|uniref:RND family efflux transporter, MFP subunit n=2 Tax=Abditibacterium utsteinense TaxID=1960156 RepID=A0A2S8SUE8_9BACT|nr:RND family efflux transporter, MFP subunit [Abditibacterium utsteinense]
MNVQTTQKPPSRPDEIVSPGVAPKRKGSPAIPAIIGIAALLGIGLFLRGRGASKPAEAPRGPQIKTVKVIPVTIGTLVQRIAVTGSLKANQNIDLNPKISGRVAQVTVSEGQRVRRGQLLATLDDADLREAVNSARAGLATQQVRLRQVEVGLPARVAQVGSNIETARAALATAKARYQQALLNEPTQISNAQSQVGTARAGVAAANSRLKQARDTARQTGQIVNAGIASARSTLAGSLAQLEQVRNGSRAQQVAQAQASVNVAIAQRDDAQTNLNRQTILFKGGATAKATVDSAQTQLEVAQAQLQAAQQNLSLVREGSRTEEVRAAEAAVSGQEAGLRQAQAQRGNILTAQQQVTQALTGVQTAQEALRTSQSNLSTIPITRQETRTAQEAVNQADTALRQAISNRSQIPVAQQDVPAARAAVQTAQVQLNQAQNQLSYARIFSPINGVVNTKSTDVGESASPGTPLFNLVSLDDVYFEAQVPESQLASIKVGQPAQVTVSAVSNKPATGYVSDIIRVADARLRQFRIRISLPNSGNFTPGAFARGQLQTQVISNTLLVPDEVIRTEANKSYVLVAVPGDENAVVKRREITIGTSANGSTQILGGLGDGDRVIRGNTVFEDGDKIKIAKSDDAGAARNGAGSSESSAQSGAPGKASGSESGASGTSSGASGASNGGSTGGGSGGA